MRTNLGTGLALASLVLSTILVTGAGGAAIADPDGTVLPFPHFDSMVTDHARDLAYVSGDDDGGTGKVAVVDGSGAVTRTFDGLLYPTGMTLSDDDTTLYVAVGAESPDGSEAIVGIDLSTGARRTWDLGEVSSGVSGSCDTDLAVVDGRIWFNLCPDNRSITGLGVLDPETGAVHDSYVVGDVGADLASDPQLPHRLVVGAAGIYTLAISYDDSGAPDVTVLARRTGAEVGGSLSMAPGGAYVLVGGSVLRTSDLASVDSFPAEYAASSAESADGTVAVGGGEAYPGDGSDLFVYRPGHTVFAQQTDYGFQVDDKTSVFLADQGIGFGTTSLFAVTWSGRDQRGDPPIMHVSRPDPLPDPIGMKDLAVPRVGQLVSDPAHAQEFVSTGVNGNGLIVVDERGRVTHVLQHLPGISQIALSGTTLWMSLEGRDALAAMDTRTFAVHQYFLGTDARPQAVAVAAGLVWFSHHYGGDADTFGHDSLGTLDPATGEVHPRVAPIAALRLRASAVHPHSMYASSDSLPPGFPVFSNTPEVRLNVTGGARPTATVMAAQDVGADASDEAQTPDGLSLATAGENTPWRADDALSLAHLNRLSSGYDGGRALAVRSDGLVARGYDGASFFDIDMRFGALGPLQHNVHLARASGLGPVAAEGLAFGVSDLSALIGFDSSQDSERHFRVTTIPAPPRQKLTLTTDRDFYFSCSNDRLRLVAHVEPRLLGQRPEISVQAQPHGSSARPITTDVRPDAWGNVTLSTTFEQPTTFTAQVHYGTAGASTKLYVKAANASTSCH